MSKDERCGIVPGGGSSPSNGNDVDDGAAEETAGRAATPPGRTGTVSAAPDPKARGGGDASSEREARQAGEEAGVVSDGRRAEAGHAPSVDAPSHHEDSTRDFESKQPAGSVQVSPAPVERLGRTVCLLCLFSMLLGIIVLARGTEGTLEASGGSLNAELTPFGIASGGEGIAVVKIYGVISFEDDAPSFPGPFSRGADRTVKILRRLRKARNIKGIVLRVNSPGGTVGASQEIHDEIAALVAKGKPVVVSMGDVAASGGYYVSAPASYIFANPGTLTGSIGVISTLLNYRSVLDKLGLKYKVFKSGRYKDMGAGYREMSPEEEKLFQDICLGAWDQFVDAVAEGRIIDEKTAERYGRKRVITSKEDMREHLCQGQVFLGSEACRVGLVDELGTLHDAIAKCGELSGLGPEPRVIRADRTTGIERLMELFEGRSIPDPVKVLMRAGSLPPVLYLYMPGR